MPATILLLPGLYNSGAGHWQTLWEETLPGTRRVMQFDWDAPDRDRWVATLDQAIEAAESDVVLAAHSLGCVTAAWWAVSHGNAAHAGKVKAALMVAVPDVERADFPSFATGFAPMPSVCLPFNATVVASSDDPWCELPRAQSWASAWGANFQCIGTRGHINAESGLREWSQGQQWLRELVGD